MLIPPTFRLWLCLRKQQHNSHGQLPIISTKLSINKKHLKNVGPIRHNEPLHANSPGVATVLSHAARASISTTPTTPTRDRGDRYGPIEWAQLPLSDSIVMWLEHSTCDSAMVRSNPGSSAVGLQPWASCSHPLA